jgi:hypothetical protein
MSTKTLNTFMEFEKLVMQVLHEDSVAGGEGSVFGSGVISTASAFSSDSYAPGDARNPYGIYGGVLTRSGMRKRKTSKKQKRKTSKRRKK